jgi:hypothetical protein
MKYLWRILNAALVILCTWSGYWAVAPERLNDRGFIQSAVPVGPGYPPIGFSCVVIFFFFGICSFLTYRPLWRRGGPFRLPSWDRNPVRAASDPLQGLVITLIALGSGTVAATLRFLFGSTLGLGAILFLWSWDIGILVGALIAYALFRPRVVV